MPVGPHQLQTDLMVFFLRITNFLLEDAETGSLRLINSVSSSLKRALMKTSFEVPWVSETELREKQAITRHDIIG